MKRFLKGFSVLLFVLLTIFLSFTFFINPAIKNIEKSNKIVLLTNDELNEKELSIKTKYLKEKEDLNSNYNTKEKEVDAKYIKLQSDLEVKYNNLEQDIKIKYDALIKEAAKKYTKKMSDQGWYEESVAQMEEESSIRSKMNNEISSNISLKWNEGRNLDTDKKKELSALNLAKENELIKLDLLEKNAIEKIDINSKKNEKIEFMLNGVTLMTIGVVIILSFLIYIILIVNSIIKLHNKVLEKYSAIGVLLKRRSELIPNIVECIKVYSKHEAKTIENIIKARNDGTSSSKEILVLNEKYPELKADRNFRGLQNELVKTEDDIAQKRNQYNDAILKYKNKISVFPNNFFASIFNYQDISYLEINNNDKENIKVELD